MKTLITPAQVIALAFADGEYVAPEAVTEADIAAAGERYIAPVVGRSLYARLIEGTYADFTTEYLAAPTALFTRLLVQPGMDIRTGQCGTVAPKSGFYQPAAEGSIRAQRRAIRTKARTLLHRAVKHLEENPRTCPEYDPDQNIFRSCAICGDLVLTR